MSRIFILLSFMLSSSLAIAADKNMDAFVKKAKSMSGQYKLAKGSNSSCSDGYLSFVGGDVQEGLHLGHHVFIGPFDEKVEQQKDYCNIDQKFSFSENSVTQITKLSRCPASAKADESVATKSLVFKGKDLYFEIKESGFKCHYVLVEKGGSHE